MAKQPFEKKVKATLEEIDKLLKRKKMALRPVITFPLKKKIPFLAKIALWVVAKQGGIVDIEFIDIKK